MSQWLRWDLNQGLLGYKPFSLTTGPYSLQMTFNREKCKVLHTGNKNVHYLC